MTSQRARFTHPRQLRLKRRAASQRTRSPPLLQAPSVEGLSVANLMHNIEEKNCTSLLEGALGLPLREKNLGPLQSKLQQQGKVVLETDLQHDACGAGGPLAGLPKADRKMPEMLKAAIDRGGVRSKSYLGNKFREEVKKSSAAGQEYQRCISRAEGAALRLNWCRRAVREHLREGGARAIMEAGTPMGHPPCCD